MESSSSFSPLSSAQAGIGISESDPEQALMPEAEATKKRKKQGSKTTFSQKKGKGHRSKNPPSNDSTEGEVLKKPRKAKVVAMSNIEQLSQALDSVAEGAAAGTGDGGGGEQHIMLPQQDERLLISLLYRKYGAPPPKECDGRNGVVSRICSAINYSPNQREKVKTVIERTYQALLAGEEYDPKRKEPQMDEHYSCVIKKGSQVYQLVADYMTTGMSYTDMTNSINDLLLSVGEPTVTRSAIYSCAQRMIKEATAGQN